MRTQEEINKMIKSLESELSSAPAYNAYGDSNAEIKAELRGWIRELETGVYEPTGDVAYWIAGSEHSALNDVEVQP